MSLYNDEDKLTPFFQPNELLPHPTVILGVHQQIVSCLSWTAQALI
jgi:hypothetical protein